MKINNRVVSNDHIGQILSPGCWSKIQSSPEMKTGEKLCATSRGSYHRIEYKIIPVWRAIKYDMRDHLRLIHKVAEAINQSWIYRSTMILYLLIKLMVIDFEKMEMQDNK